MDYYRLLWSFYISLLKLYKAETFNKTDVGKLLLYFLHEQGNGLSTINYSIKGLEYKLDNNLPIEEKELRDIIEWIRSGITRSRNGADYLYVKLKELEGY